MSKDVEEFTKVRVRAGISRVLAGLLPSVLVIPSVGAVEFSFMDSQVKGSLDSTVSYGAAWRVQSQDKNNDAFNGNDGDRNFSPGLISQVYKLTSELSATYQNYGVFVRGSAFYDSQIMNNHTDYYDHSDIVEPSQNYPKDNRFTYEARRDAGRGGQLLDAYIYGKWDPFDHPLSVRVGKQVFNWGESVFYRGGVNTTNPLDVTKFRLPGSQLKEVLVPVGALSFNLGLTDNLSMEAFYQVDWKESSLDPVGTYYSTTDLFGKGGKQAYVQVPELSPAFAAYQGIAAAVPGIGLGAGPHGINSFMDANTGIFKVANVGKDIKARDSGQFGINLHYIAPALNYTDFGFYFVNYHTKEPLESLSLANYKGIDLASLSGVAGSNAGAIATLDMVGNAVVQRAYVEDVHMYGFSFNTTLGNASLFGELAYRPNMPISISATNDLLGDILGQGIAGTTNIYDSSVAGGQACVQVSGKSLCRDGTLNNYKRVESYNASVGTIYNFGPALSFDSVIGIAELAGEHLGGNLTYTAFTPTPEVRKFAGSPDLSDSPISRNSYGYTLVITGTWNDVYAGVNLSPSINYSDDVKGNSDLTGNFMEGRKAYTFGVKADYRGGLETELQYTTFSGAGKGNTVRDRDNVSFDVKYSF
ncbi:glycine/betaine transmethylase [Pseudomonas sp. 2822-15]|uniref:DUF1302 domain-containing protein n=1 Tax=Pseudomonas salomonii TaxID=191391 RepID=A0A7Y8GEQ8_9PSED|nr:MULTISPECIES: DUF1302 domain-containing protein [Pseudomonas]NWF09360.1 DUF1302 domain-containing protein [Pseudomonas salomonii]PIB42024.1 glycine/betaine transmethylase [Pseudomonas sp. 2822-15]CRM48978.1 hypothetical protein [Pseudomonas sp. 58 R 3]